MFTNQIVLFEHIYTLAKFVYDTGSCFDPAQQLRPNLLLGTKDLGPGPLINPISTDQCDQIGQLFKALATINLPKTCTFLGNFCKRVKIYHFPSEIHSLGNFYRHLAIFSGHTGLITNISGGRMTSINRKK